MHELSIAAAIVELAQRHAAGRRVSRVEIRVGALRQVVPGSLTFAFDLLTEDTPLAGAELAIEQVPAQGLCGECGAEGTLERFPWRCARCGADNLELHTGEELLVEALELVEEPRLQRFMRIGTM